MNRAYLLFFLPFWWEHILERGRLDEVGAEKQATLLLAPQPAPTPAPVPPTLTPAAPASLPLAPPPPWPYPYAPGFYFLTPGSDVEEPGEDLGSDVEDDLVEDFGSDAEGEQAFLAVDCAPFSS